MEVLTQVQNNPAICGRGVLGSQYTVIKALALYVVSILVR